MKAATFVNSFRLENFKAIQQSKTIKLTPLTVLIGNNGSGKSSFVEGLATYQRIVVDGLDEGMERWLGMQHVWNKAARHKLNPQGHYENPMKFAVSARIKSEPYRFDLAVNAKPGMNGIFIQEENFVLTGITVTHRTANGMVSVMHDGKSFSPINQLKLGETALPNEIISTIERWQFLSLMPDQMGGPRPKKMSADGDLTLNADGSNIAQYLLMIRNKDIGVFDGIVESMRFVLDYAENFEPFETREVQRTMFVQMRERDYEIPGWMLSTGTLRILALLAVLRNPDPPPLIVVEEIENGLDPRTVHMVLEEIREVVRSGRSQVILTTHSPYLLDLLPLQTMIVVQRESGGDPVFWRPSDSAQMQEWAKEFAPGQLYTGGRFQQGGRP
jgi:predicted ATPase